MRYLILKINLLLSLLLWSGSALPQLVKQDSLEFFANITSYSADRTGYIYIGFEGGGIIKYNQQLDSINSYSPSKVGDIVLLEAWHGFQTFAFYEEFQDFLLLDRFLTRDTRYDLGGAGLGYINLCTISADQNLWLIEENRLELLKLNLTSREVDINMPLEAVLGSGDHKFSFIREYQNLLFLVDELSGIYVFDNLGNYLKKIDIVGLNYISFDRNQLVAITGKNLSILNLYSDSRKTYELEQLFEGVIAIRNQLFLINGNRIVSYKALPDGKN